MLTRMLDSAVQIAKVGLGAIATKIPSATSGVMTRKTICTMMLTTRRTVTAISAMAVARGAMHRGIKPSLSDVSSGSGTTGECHSVWLCIFGLDWGMALVASSVRSV